MLEGVARVMWMAVEQSCEIVATARLGTEGTGIRRVGTGR
jgi:hypothetical protein